MPDLKDATEFVRAAFGNLGKDCQVSLLLDSNPAWPDYVVDMLFDDEIEGEIVEVPQTLAVFSGRRHHLLETDLNRHRPQSTVPMRWLEVRALLGELRHYKPKPPVSPQ